MAYYLNTAGSDVLQTSGQACLKNWLAAGGRAHTGYLVKVSVGAVKKTLVGYTGGN